MWGGGLRERCRDGDIWDWAMSAAAGKIKYKYATSDNAQIILRCMKNDTKKFKGNNIDLLVHLP